MPKCENRLFTNPLQNGDKWRRRELNPRTVKIPDLRGGV